MEDDDREEVAEHYTEGQGEPEFAFAIVIS